ncbi:hypothetical protein RFI_22251 [Reticulomyxa filosa]|uniref:Uncharacterized protein n=1 Tax=Reticulomyxa filosa TaxID=46433 RepID=X6MPU1_RETFI|nr:hypothetical protein RFI_22251 [Reticulomyxa filosa]|eukprot:ETO15115.1 hypothetical protein RFI_22251 [Reticulomyxa filosa]
MQEQPSDLKQDIEKIRAEEADTELTFKLIRSYKLNATRLHNTLDTIAKQSPKYIEKYVLHDQLQKCDSLVERYNKMWVNIKFSIHEINSKKRQKMEEDYGMSKYVPVAEKDLYQLPILEKLLDEDAKIKTEKSISAILMKDPIFIALKNDLKFSTYDDFVAIHNQMKEFESSIHEFHNVYKEILQGKDRMNLDQDKYQEDGSTLKEAYYINILNRFTMLLGFKAQYFFAKQEDAGEGTSWLKWIENQIFRYKSDGGKQNSIKDTDSEQRDKGRVMDILDEFKDINDPSVKQIIHNKFQSFIIALTGQAKFQCFGKAIEELNDASDCRVKELVMNANVEQECDYKIIKHRANTIIDNCLEIFFMKTIHDKLLAEAISKASRIKAKTSDDEAQSLFICSERECEALDPDTREAFYLENPRDILAEGSSSINDNGANN